MHFAAGAGDLPEGVKVVLGILASLATVVSLKDRPRAQRVFIVLYVFALLGALAFYTPVIVAALREQRARLAEQTDRINTEIAKQDAAITDLQKSIDELNKRIELYRAQKAALQAEAAMNSATIETIHQQEEMKKAQREQKLNEARAGILGVWTCKDYGIFNYSMVLRPDGSFSSQASSGKYELVDISHIKMVWLGYSAIYDLASTNSERTLGGNGTSCRKAP